MKKNLYVFDFDGTLTTKDTLIAFICYAKGWWRLLFWFAIYSPLLVLMKLRLYPNGRLKQQLFARFFSGMPLEAFNELCRRFAEDRRRLLRPCGLAALEEAHSVGADVVIVSASIENWVREFVDATVIGTRIEVAGDRLTGRFSTPNCYGDEKVSRLQRLYPDREAVYITAFGDSRGDEALLSFADKAYWQHRNGYQLWHRQTLIKRIERAFHIDFGEVLRFGMVGLAATALQYLIYWALLWWLHPALANTIGYALSFVFNYIASTRFTFKVASTARRGAGFMLSHAINYTLQTVLLTFFLWVGVSKTLALLPVICICVPVNFLLVRFFLKRG